MAPSTSSSEDTSVDKTFVIPIGAPQPRLIITSGHQEGRQFLLQAGSYLIGRATSKTSWDIALQDRSISRPHAKLEKGESGYVITDQGSANGTLVNGERILEPFTLRNGDLIKLGETVLVFRIK